ncbi:MAG: bifunctional aldolase/short-chain dehydrogenase [Sandaracinaceae bacterium]
MESRYDPALAPDDPLALRAYTSRLLGAEPTLVLHGGGNTSVKHTRADFFGDEVEVLSVKGSGWDLAAIEPPGFAPVRLDVLQRMAALPDLNDPDMVREQRAAMLDPSAPNPSVEAILHALIPSTYVDHTHADAVVTLSNSPDGEARLRALYGDRVLFIPYVMPGFVLAKKVYELTRGVDWEALEGMILLNHGVFTFADDAQTSYERMIQLVSEAEGALQEAHAWDVLATTDPGEMELLSLAALRGEVSRVAGRAMIARSDTSSRTRGFASRADAAELATRGPVTPDHVIRTKRIPVVVEDKGHEDAIDAYAEAYRGFFERNADGQTMLDPAPRWAVWKGRGLVAFGKSVKAADQVRDIANTTLACIQRGEALGGWTPLGEKDLFDMEYWELEQAKLKKGGAPAPFAGKVALVTGGATGIGRAIAEALRAQGAAVCVLDIAESILETFASDLPILCDVTDRAALDAAVARCVETYGGLDVVVANAGDFPKSQALDAIDDAVWERTIELNLTSHMRTLRAAAPYLAHGFEPAVLFVASKNVPAPGPGAAAYSTSKAALTQLMRVAALELGPKGVRVNALHPDKVFDTDLWSEEKIRLRAEHYGLSVEAYKRSNLLGVEIVSRDVANAACALLGPTFRATTGAQVPLDGGNERVI